ncbi:MAG: type I restriction enzyme endonuclease domain-containing protein [Candidatus Heimdallarchaeota archaeon]
MFCLDRGIEPDDIIEAEQFLKIKLLDDAVDSLLATEKTKNDYLLLAKSVKKLYKAILPDESANTYTPKVALYVVLAEKIRSLDPSVDISEVMKEISDLLDRSIASEGFIIKEAIDPETQQSLDLRTLSLDSLKAKFIKGRKNTQVERLMNSIRITLHRMIELNNSRKDLAKKFRELVDAYNQGIYNTDIFFEKLLAFTKELNLEEKRGITENLSEEELAVFDLLFKDDLSKKERDKVKDVAKELLIILKQERKLVIDWRKKQKTRAAVRYTIEIQLENKLPESYDQKLYYKKCDQIYQHIYDNYFGENQSTYSTIMKNKS